ncbi:MAG: fibronectin type III domain-containing protein [Candidatus Acidiferrum sp.]
MIDPYLLSAPFLLLGIVALLRFVGCGFTPSAADPAAPTNLVAKPLNAEVDLTWTDPDGGTGYSYQVNRGSDGGGSHAVVATVTDPSYHDTGLTNGTTYTYTVSIAYGMTVYGTSEPVTATPVSLPGRPPGSVLDPMNPLATNLIGLFVMNEGTGAMQGLPAIDRNLVDGQTANPVGAAPPTWDVADPSILFNGGTPLNSYLDAGVDTGFNDMPTSKITIVAKVLVNALANAGICEKNDGKGPNTDSGFLFSLTPAGSLQVTVELTAHSMRVQTAGGVVIVGQWMQMAFTWDGNQYIPPAGATPGKAPATAATIYINQVAQIPATSSDGQGNLDVTRLANNLPFRIGNATFDFPGCLNGKVAYVAVYKGVLLTTTQLAMLDTQLPIKSA